MKNPVLFRTHGGRPSDISLGRTPIDAPFITGIPQKLSKGDRVVAEVISRTGELQDKIYNVKG